MPRFNFEELRVLKWLQDSGGILSRADLRRKCNPKEVWRVYEKALAGLVKKGDVTVHTDQMERLEHPGPITRWYSLKEAK